MFRQFAAVLLAAGLTAGAVSADDVHLVNGESFEGVIARQEGDQVLIRLEFGELKLPATSVASIAPSRSPLGEYLERRERLSLNSGSGAEWAELGLWARSRELGHGFREALFRAAELDPHLDVLKPEMRRLDYVLDTELDRWITYEAHMLRSGFVRCEGEWMRSDQCRVETEARQARADSDEVDVALSRTVELLARAQLERELRETEDSRRTTSTVPAGPYVPYGYPVAYFGGHFVRPSGEPVETPANTPAAAEEVLRRPPGSLLRVGGDNRGRIRQPGSLIRTRGSY